MDTLAGVEARGGTIGWFDRPDGTRLRHARFPADRGAAASGQLLLLHGRTEYIEKYLETIGELGARGYEVWTFDWRGQGLSSRALADPRLGHVDRFESFLDDLAAFLDEVMRPPAPPVALAHSMGGHLLLRFLARRPGAVSRAVLSAPMVDFVTPPGPRWLLNGTIRTLRHLGGSGRAVPGAREIDRLIGVFEGNLLTSDPGRFARMQAWLSQEPRLGIGPPTLAWIDSANHSVRLLADPAEAARVTTPVLIVSAGDDRVVRNSAQHRFAAMAPNCRIETIAASRHEILMERDPIRAEFWRLFDGFVGSRAERT
jgi:lysophospholipase